MIENGIADEAAIQKVQDEVAKRVEESVAFAEAGAVPDPQQVYAMMYKGLDPDARAL